MSETPPAQTGTVLQVRDVSRSFGGQAAVEKLSFDVDQGETVALLGPNGAGKSTTMRMITGYLAPSSGDIILFPKHENRSCRDNRKHIGYLPEGAPLYDEMTPSAFLDFVGRCHGLVGASLGHRKRNVVARLGLQAVMEQPIGTLSKGFRRRTAFAAAIIHDPPLLVLDEPTDGLDPNQKHEVRQLLEDLRKDRAILISTHLLEEVSTVCTRAIVIAKGQLITDTTPAELSARGPLDQVFRTLTQPVQNEVTAR